MILDRSTDREAVQRFVDPLVGSIRPLGRHVACGGWIAS
jgi:hypothetical protein